MDDPGVLAAMAFVLALGVLLVRQIIVASAREDSSHTPTADEQYQIYRMRRDSFKRPKGK
jgi:hypothetical protein